jgi:hypothetical protein
VPSRSYYQPFSKRSKQKKIFEGTQNIGWKLTTIIIYITTGNAFRYLWHSDTVKLYKFYLAHSNTNRPQRLIGYVKKNKINILKLILHLIVPLISIYNNNWIVLLATFIGHVF